MIKASIAKDHVVILGPPLLNSTCKPCSKPSHSNKTSGLDYVTPPMASPADKLLAPTRNTLMPVRSGPWPASQRQRPASRQHLPAYPASHGDPHCVGGNIMEQTKAVVCLGTNGCEACNARTIEKGGRVSTHSKAREPPHARKLHGRKVCTPGLPVKLSPSLARQDREPEAQLHSCTHK